MSERNASMEFFQKLKRSFFNEGRTLVGERRIREVALLQDASILN